MNNQVDKKPIEFTELSIAINNFKMEVFKVLKIPQIVEWMSKHLNN